MNSGVIRHTDVQTRKDAVGPCRSLNNLEPPFSLWFYGELKERKLENARQLLVLKFSDRAALKFFRCDHSTTKEHGSRICTHCLYSQSTNSAISRAEKSVGFL